MVTRLDQVNFEKRQNNTMSFISIKKHEGYIIKKSKFGRFKTFYIVLEYGNLMFYKNRY